MNIQTMYTILKHLFIPSIDTIFNDKPEIVLVQLNYVNDGFTIKNDLITHIKFGLFEISSSILLILLGLFCIKISI